MIARVRPYPSEVMRTYVIDHDRIMLREQNGDRFEFRLIASGSRRKLQLVGFPEWQGGVAPKHAAARIEVARGAARNIVRDRGLID